jgi:hypothetical protein
MAYFRLLSNDLYCKIVEALCWTADTVVNIKIEYLRNRNLSCYQQVDLVGNEFSQIESN